MQLRRNEQTLKQKLDRKRQMKDETVKYQIAQLLPKTWQREATKQSLDKIHDEQFELAYQAMLKENNIENKQEMRNSKKEELLP